MYDLCPRFTEKAVKETNPGPTTYFVSYPECINQKESTYPLTSTSSRFKPCHVVNSPSPAHYYPKYRKHRILGGKSMQFTTPRICIVPKKKVPHLPYIQQYTKTSLFFTKSSAKINRSSLFKHFYSCRKSEISETTKEIVLQRVSTSKSLPDYLNFPGETSKASIKYKGSHWAQYTGKRLSFERISHTPGPGTYNIKPKEVPRKEAPSPTKILERKKCQPSFEDTQPALQEITGEEDHNKGTNFFDGTCDYLFKKVSHNKSPFGIWDKSKRFIYKENENPPPWAYNPSGRVHCLRKIVKIVPFASCLARFKAEKMVDLGPSSYSQQYNTIQERTCNSLPKIRGTLVAPFGSTAPRLKPQKMESSEDEDEDELDDQDYLTITRVELDLPDTEPSILSEKTESEGSEDKERYEVEGTSLRIRDIPPENPPMVDMRLVINNLKGRKSHRINKADEGFLSANYNRTKWLVVKTPAHDVNWPKIENNLKVKGGAMKMNSDHAKPQKPKPDLSVFYDIHPQYGSAVYKSTHNYRLKTDREIVKAHENPDNVKTILKCFMPKEILYA